MKRTRNRMRYPAGTAILLAALAFLLAGCQVLTDAMPAVFPKPTVAVAAGETPLPPTQTSRPREPLPATSTPAPEVIPPTATQKTALPALLVDFPLFDDARVVAQETGQDASSAALVIRTGKGPGDLESFYRQALEAKGWTLRFSDGNPVGGFVQEWKKEQRYVTLEYHFSEQQPLLNVDARLVDSNRALAMLLGFPLPNGSEVLRAEGSSIELYVPQDLQSTVDFFQKETTGLRWRFETIKPTGWCGSRTCQETLKDEYRLLAELRPTPTADVRKVAYYRVTMPDRTQAEITFLPRQAYTRVYIKINFLDILRSGIPVTLYPRASVTGILPGVAMFETSDSMQAVIKFYEEGLAGLGWKAHDFTVNQPDMYTRSWTKNPSRVVTLTLSKSKGKVYGTLNCLTCRDPYYILPTTTPSPAPSR